MLCIGTLRRTVRDFPLHCIPHSQCQPDAIADARRFVVRRDPSYPKIRRRRPIGGERDESDATTSDCPRLLQICGTRKVVPLSVMPGRGDEALLRADVPGIHVLALFPQERRGWPGQAWTSPAMTRSGMGMPSSLIQA